MTQTSATDNGKTIAVISYITIIGWIIAFIMHNNNKTKLGAFHIRQMLGLMLLGISVSVVANIIGIALLVRILQIAILVLWAIGLIGAIQGEQKKIPLLGDQFQEWFKGLG